MNENQDVEVSIVVPVYNVEPFLRECLTSIQHQTFANWEGILVNDGSTDNSRSICVEFTCKDSRFRIVDQENQGLSAARNTGLRLASGKYISFVDSDDFIHSEMLEVLVNAAEECRSDIVGCGRYVMTDTTVAPVFHHSDERLVLRTTDEIMAAYFDGRLKSTCCDKLYRRSLYEDVDFPVGRLHEDHFVTPKLLLASDRVLSLRRPLYYYRQRGGSIMSSFTAERFDIVSGTLHLGSLLESHGLLDSYVDAYQKRLADYVLMSLRWAAYSNRLSGFLKVHRFLFNHIRRPRLRALSTSSGLKWEQRLTIRVLLASSILYWVGTWIRRRLSQAKYAFLRHQ